MIVTTPFFTDIDSRAAIKGSRDPLGAQPIWVHFGRQVIGNLTTVSSSSRDFAILLLGYYFVERLREEGCGEGDVATFLKWEQLANYVRAFKNGVSGFRGTERVTARLEEDRGRITLGASREQQILADQKIYGLWGLYSTPARASGLVQAQPARLTPVARAFVEATYISPLRRSHNLDQQIVEHLSRKRATIDLTAGVGQRLTEALGKILLPGLNNAEKEFLRTHLLVAEGTDSTDGAQPLLAEMLNKRKSFQYGDMGLHLLRDLHKQSVESGHYALSQRLRKIVVSECLIAPATAIFSYLLSLDGETIDTVGDRMRQIWGPSPAVQSRDDVSGIEGDLELATGDVAGAAARLLEFAGSLHVGDYAGCIRTLVQHSAEVMKRRHASAPWVTIEKNRLNVSIRDQRETLPDRDTLPHYWRFTYFISSLAQIEADTRRGAAQ